MAANTTPIFPLTPQVSWGTITDANTAKDGTGTVVTVFTAGANGARVDEIKIKPLGTNVATVMRFFINNGQSNEIAANNSLYLEQTLAEATESAVEALAEYAIEPDNLVLPAGYKLNVTLGTEVAAGYQVTVLGGDY